MTAIDEDGGRGGGRLLPPHSLVLTHPDLVAFGSNGDGCSDLPLLSLSILTAAIVVTSLLSPSLSHSRPDLEAISSDNDNSGSCSDLHLRSSATMTTAAITETSMAVALGNSIVYYMLKLLN